MHFSPYRQPSSVEIDWESFEAEEYVYDSDDSEDWEFPVHQASNSEAWSQYEKDTKAVVADAIEAKSIEVLKLDKMIQSWSSTRIQHTCTITEEEVVHVSDLLDSINLEHENEDRIRAEAFEHKNQALLQAVEKSISLEIRKAETASRIAKEAEEDRLRKIAHEAEQEARLAEATRLKKEEEARHVLKLEKERQEADARRSQAEQQALKAAEAATQLAKEREEALGTSPEEDATTWRDLLEKFKLDVLKPVSESKDLKNYCHKARLKINPRVGQVTNSIEQVGQVSSSLKALFEEAGTKDPKGLTQKWCLNFFCKAIVRQAEGEVMVKPTACYPLAFLAISLMKQFPDLRELYLCRIAKKCPWTIPFVGYDKGTESGRKLLGWKRKADGKYEESTAYLERQEGIFRLWAATASLNLKASPFPIENTWKFISRLLNTSIADEELRNVSFAMVSSFLDISGKTFLKVYGNQGNKIILAIARWVGPDTRGANASRLRILVEAYVTSGQVGLDFEFER